MRDHGDRGHETNLSLCFKIGEIIMKFKLTKTNRWPYAITTVIVLFVGWLITLLVLVSGENFDLVAADYYAQEIAYQQQIDKMERAQFLGQKPVVSWRQGERQIEIELPASDGTEKIEGVVYFFRPSDARLDFSKKISLNARNKQRFNAAEMKNGLWKVKTEWRVGSEKFYHETTVVVF